MTSTTQPATTYTLNDALIANQNAVPTDPYPDSDTRYNSDDDEQETTHDNASAKDTEQADAKTKKKASAKAKKQAEQANKAKKQAEQDDKYTQDVCRTRYKLYYDAYMNTVEIIKTTGLPIRHQNPPEDLTENIVKFIVQNYDNDPSCKWAKGLKLKGDLYSDKYHIDSPPEVKAFTSGGPSQFGPTKKFGVLYFLDLRKWLDDKITLWRVNLTNESTIWKNIKMNKKETNEDQCVAGRRPHISWDKIHPQISDYCVKVYEGNFEGIFTPSVTV